MFFFPFVGFLLLWGYLRISGGSFRDLGFSWSRCTIRSFITGSIIGVGYAGAVWFVIGPLLQALGFKGPDLSDFYGIRTNLSQYIVVLVIAWAWVIPYEEIIFRGFLLNTLQKWVSAYWIAGILSSVLFAAYHWQEGWSAVISIFIFSLVATWIYQHFNKNLWYVIFFHAVYDTVMLTLIRAGYFGG